MDHFPVLYTLDVNVFNMCNFFSVSIHKTIIFQSTKTVSGQVWALMELFRIKAAREETATKPDSGPPANELLSGASLIALEKEHVAKVLQKRAKKQAFEAAQAEFFAARHNETVKTAHEKHSRAQAFRAQVKANEEAHFDQKRQTFARKQQRAKDGFQRWEENKDEERRQLQRRDAEIAARTLGARHLPCVR